MNMAKVFIGMPVYNGERFIGQAIQSLLDQTFRDFVLFISDDASTDKTGEICRSYAEEDSRIRYYRQPQNIGMFPNFKLVLDAANTPYFMWAAQDDLWEKEFLATCLAVLEKRPDIGVAMTSMADADSFGRNLRELSEFYLLSGELGVRSVTRFVLQPEVLGKCNIMYALYRLPVLRKAFALYPMRNEWGTDYHFSLAVISHFGIMIDRRVLFKKRHGGFSNPRSTANDKEEVVRQIIYKNPKNYMFPFGRFRSYFRGHMEALRDTPYRPLAAFLLYLRLPRALGIHAKERGMRFFSKLWLR